MTDAATRRHAALSYVAVSASDAATLDPAALLAPLAAVGPVTHLAGADGADVAIGGPAARADNGVSGAGIRIGILSDSLNLLGGEASDIAAGLLPAAGVSVLNEGPAGAGMTDEGRAMAQLLHQTAPGAQLYFYTAFEGQQDFANGIDALRGAGCQIIVDDITYPDEPMFQVAGPIDGAVQRAVAAGVDYFTAVGNEGTSFYQANFAPFSAVVTGVNASQPVLAQRFTNGTALQGITIPADLAVTLTLEWNAPYSANNPDSLTVDALAGAQIVASSNQTAGEPEVALNLPVTAQVTSYSIVIYQNPGTPTPGIIKYVLEGGGSIQDARAGIGSGSAIGHALVAGVDAVGAVDVGATPSKGGTPTPEPYSSSGSGQILLAPDGSALTTPQSAPVPQFLAPDGASTSVFDPFFGTSAAAPAAAATAALMLQAAPGISNADVTTLLEDSATPAGPASVAGAGLIQANLAVGYARSGLISGSPQPVILGTSRGVTIQDGGGAHWVQAGSGPTSIEAAGNDTVVAGAGPDTVDLTGSSALLNGGSGSLLVGTVGGRDTVTGGAGSVTVAGGPGAAVETGGTAGHNLLIAGSQPGWLVAGGANDTLVAAGAGADSLVSNVFGPVTLSAGQGGGLSSGGNFYSVAGGGGALVETGPGVNTVFLDGGNATVVLGGAEPPPVASAHTLSDGTQVAFSTLLHTGSA